jgi:hypothetical protein
MSQVATAMPSLSVSKRKFVRFIKASLFSLRVILGRSEAKSRGPQDKFAPSATPHILHEVLGSRLRLARG